MGKTSDRRGNAEGTVYWVESRQIWNGQIRLLNYDGKRVRKVVSGKTQQACYKAMKNLADLSAKEILDKPPEPDSSVWTVSSWIEEWVDSRVKAGRKFKYLKFCRDFARNYITPTIGPIPLTDLTAQDVQSRLIDPVIKAGTLSPRSIHHLRVVLSTALNYAMLHRERTGLTENVAGARLIVTPEVTKPEITPLTLDQTRTFLHALGRHRLGPYFTLLVMTGAREAELLGARWQDFDLDAGTWAVRSSLSYHDQSWWLDKPKTEKSQAPIPLIPDAVRLLSSLKHDQELARLVDGAKPFDAFVFESTGRKPGFRSRSVSDLVFATRNGSPHSARNVLRTFHRIREECGLPYSTVHWLRHTTASLLMDRGISIEDVSEILRHNDLRTTYAWYRNVGLESKRKSIGQLEGLFSPQI